MANAHQEFVPFQGEGRRLGGDPHSNDSVTAQAHRARQTRQAAATRIQRAVRARNDRRALNDIQGMRRNIFRHTLGSTHTGQRMLDAPGLMDNMNFTRTEGAGPTYQAGADGAGTMELGTTSSYGGRGFDGNRQRREYIASTHHEAIHRINHREDPAAYDQRRGRPGEHGPWSNQEEQFTIEGRHPNNPQRGNLPQPYATENQVRAELGLADRNSHRAIQEDLPNRMNHQQYQAHHQARMQQGAQELAQMNNQNRGFQLPPHLRARLNEGKKKGGGDGKSRKK